MAARTAPARTAAQHQSLLHFVNVAPWSDEKVLIKAREMVLPAIERDGPIEAWIIDDTSFPKQGTHSVGVHHQYCGELGKQANCQVAVSLSIANHCASLPIAYRLYLPKVWAEDMVRRDKAGVPAHIGFKTKPEIALEQMRWACEAGVPRGAVLMDVAYGNDSQLRTGITAMGLSYVAGIQPNTLMWPSGAGPKRRGKPLNNTGRRDEPDLISAKELGLALPKHAWRAIRWREGSAHWIDAGALPVGENDRLVGMITDRDITVRAVGAGKGPDTPIREVMSKDVRYCFEDDELDEVAENMADIKVRRLPVLNRDKRLVGILSLGDIALTEGAGSAGSALCGISEPGGEHSQSIDGGRAGRAAR